MIKYSILHQPRIIPGTNNNHLIPVCVGACGCRRRHPSSRSHWKGNLLFETLRFGKRALSNSYNNPFPPTLKMDWPSTTDRWLLRGMSRSAPRDHEMPEPLRRPRDTLLKCLNPPEMRNWNGTISDVTIGTRPMAGITNSPTIVYRAAYIRRNCSIKLFILSNSTPVVI